MDELKKELEEQLLELNDEEKELSRIIISLSKYPHATEALLAAFETCKDNRWDTLRELWALQKEQEEQND